MALKKKTKFQETIRFVTLSRLFKATPSKFCLPPLAGRIFT